MAEVKLYSLCRLKKGNIIEHVCHEYNYHVLDFIFPMHDSFPMIALIQVEEESSRCSEFRPCARTANRKKDSKLL